MKKRMILVGNKVIDKDISGEIEQFDFIVRLNRMNNWGMTGTRTDLYFADIHGEFLNLVEKPYDKYRMQTNIILNIENTSLKTMLKSVSMGIFSIEQIKNMNRVKMFSFNDSLLNQYGIVDQIRFTNFFLMLNYLLKNYDGKYDIYVTGIDIKNRGDIMSKFDIWQKYHKKSGYYEESILQTMCNLHKIQKLYL